MRKLLITIFVLSFLMIPVNATQFTPPTVPEDAAGIFPEDPTSFSEGIKEIFQDLSIYIRPALTDCIEICVRVISVALLTSVFLNMGTGSQKTISMASALSIAIILLTSVNTLIHLAEETILEITQYGKLLLPVMATALAAQGAPGASAALYGGTACLNAVLGSTVTEILIPLIYIFLILSIVCTVLAEPLLNKMKDSIKWCLTWILKTVLYVFTGYMSITGVISGTADAAALKATKLTISGVVPVVGGIISDASEAILVSASVMKNSAGVYGLLALVSILLSPFIKIGAQYITLKITAAFCQTFSNDVISNLLKDITSAMGLMLAMTGTCCLLQLISTVCFMRGVNL